MAAGWIEDRWLKKRPNPTTGKRERTALWGKCKRYRVAGIPGVRDRSFNTSEDAKSWLKKASADAARGEFYDPREGVQTLREYVEKTWWPTLRVPPTTKESLRPRVFNHILPHIGHYRLIDIGSDQIKWWVTQAERNIDVGTVAVTWRHFSQIMQSATAAKKIPANPFRDTDLKAPKPPKSKAQAWPRENLTAVREALAPRYRLLLDEAFGSGLRQGETLGLSPDDLDGEVIHVTRQVVKVRGQLAFAPPKGNKERDAPLPPELAEAIKKHMKEFGPLDVTLPWVDPDRPNLPWEERPTRTVRLLVTSPRHSGKSGGAINRSTFDDKQWKPALVRAGIIEAPKPGARWNMPREDGFHVLRHTFASVVLAAGETVQQLAAWLGHADPAFTYQVYAHFLPDSGSRGIAALGDWLRAAHPLEASLATETPSEPPEPLEEVPESAS